MGFMKGINSKQIHILINDKVNSEYSPRNTINDYETLALCDDGFMQQEEPVVEQELDFEGVW